MGLFEIFIPDEATKQLIVDRRGAAELDQAAAGASMIALEQAGKLAALTGQTTMEELMESLPIQ
jgi:type II secretory ATPase GspE/PulE/Tfp pilus assembly ATPase PilB-like protein